MHFTPDNTADFLQRFYSFQDGVIRRFEYTYRGRDRPAHARVIVSTQQAPETGAPEDVREEWVNIALDFVEVTEFVWAEGADAQQQVIFWDLHIRHWNEQIFVDFGWLENECIESFVSSEEGLAAFRQSKVYIAARSVTWTMQPYEEL